MESRKRLNRLSPRKVSISSSRSYATMPTISEVGRGVLIKEQGLLQFARVRDILSGAVGARRVALMAALYSLALRVAVGARALCICLEIGALSHGFCGWCPSLRAAELDEAAGGSRIFAGISSV